MPQARKFSDDQLIALHADGQSDHQIAAALGVAANSVRVRRNVLGLAAHHLPFGRKAVTPKPKPKPASHIIISERPHRRQPEPDNAQDLRRWRIGLIQDAYQRVVASKTT